MRASRLMVRILTYLLALFAASPVLAQEISDYTVSPDYAVRQWTNRNGLPNNTISALVQTSDGYLWMGTNEGLVRFDGLEFTVFNATNTPELASNRIARLQEEPAGYLWVATDQGALALYRDGRFTRFDAQIRWGSELAPWVHAEGDTVWIGMQRGLGRYVDGRLERYKSDLIDSIVNALLSDESGGFWVGTEKDGLYHLNAAGTVQHFEAGQVIDLFLDRTGRLWYVAQSEGSLETGNVFRITGNRVETIHRDGSFRIKYEDDQGNVWINALEEGTWRHASSGEVTLFRKSSHLDRADNVWEGPEGHQWRLGSVLGQSFTRQFLYRDGELIFQVWFDVSTIFFDRQGNLWIGTVTHGLFRLRRSLLQTISVAEGMPIGAAYPILEDGTGRFWVGTFGGGLFRMDQDRTSTVFDAEGSGISDHVVSLYEDRSGTIWVGGLDRTCPMQGDRCRWNALPEPFGSSINARAILEDRRGRFWIGGQGGLIVGSGEGSARRWRCVASTEGLPAWVRAITETRDGALLFGTNGDGLLRYVEDGASDDDPFEVLSTEEGLPSNLVRDLYEDRENYLWIALEDQGLCRLDRRGRAALASGDLRCMDNRDGLHQSGLHRILEDDYGRFWFNTNNGIFWVERAMLTAFLDGEIDAVTSVSYTEAEGMRNREGNGGVQPAGIKASDGRLWFPTQDGVVIIDPREVPLPEAPPVLVEAVVVGEEQRRAEEGVALSPKERDVTIRYAALEFVRAEDVRFQYYLEGYDTPWRDGSAQRQATYTNLSPGSYVFHVRAGIGGVWSEAARVWIERAPFFWETTWFLAVMGLLFVSVGPVIYAYRVRRLKANKAELEQIVAERTAELERANELKSRFLANISHEFRTPLTLTFGPLTDLLEGRFHDVESARPHLESARRNGHRLLRLINQLLELSRLDAGALLLHARRRDLARHLREIAALFESIAHQREVHFTVDIPDEPLRHVFDGDKIEKVVVNLLSNAFKFTPPGGKVSISLVRLSGGSVRIDVADTGPGIAAEHLPHLFDRFYQVESTSTRSHEGSGIGLALTKELVELHEGAIRVESTVDFGTRFTVELPPLAEPAGEEASEPVAAPSMLTESIEHVLAHEASEAAHTPDAGISEEATVVLVVEDNADMRTYIRTHLEGDYSIAEAENGAAGLEQALEMVPDLVLSDVMMPKMDGVALCAALKEDERTSHIPVVLLTAKADVEHRIAGFESGADAYLPKPFDTEELRVRVRALIAERRRLRMLFGRIEAGEDPDGAAPPTAEAVLPPREAAFVARVEEEVAAHLSETDFGVDVLADAVHMSRRQLLRKLQALTGEAPATLIRRMRLERAAELLREGASAKEAAHGVGFRSYSSFSSAFSEAYGRPPSAYGSRAD